MPNSLKKPRASEVDTLASLPWEGVINLASHWGGSGALYELLGLTNWDIDREWPAEVARARTGRAILLHLEKMAVPRFPRHSAEWLDVLSQQTYRATGFSDAPTLQTDWVATYSAFGSYPSPAYIERRSLHSHDTCFSRVLKWTANAALGVDALCASRLNSSVLSLRARRSLAGALELTELQSLASALDLDHEDVEACAATGGLWASLAKAARLLASLWAGGLAAQVHALKPILPEIEHQLFELGVFGMVCAGAREAEPDATWASAAPIAAAKYGKPAVTMRSPTVDWAAHYQSLPASYLQSDTPYTHLAQALQGGRLRPDLWIQAQSDARCEVVFECKYSLDPRYVASGIAESFAYKVEYPPAEGWRRLHVVVGPDEVVDATQVWGDEFVVTNPSGVKQLARLLVQTRLSAALTVLLE